MTLALSFETHRVTPVRQKKARHCAALGTARRIFSALRRLLHALLAELLHARHTALQRIAYDGLLIR